MADENNIYDDIDDKDEAEYESNAARRLKALGHTDENITEEPVKVDKLANFWHYNRTKILIGGAFAIIIIISLVQLINRQNPDVSILYAGPDYITPNRCETFCSTVEALIDDYNGDGKKYVQVEDMVFMSDGQIEEFIASAMADNEDAAVDRQKNAEIADRFYFEVFSGNAMICLLAEDQYEIVRDGGGFVRLDELFDIIPDGAVDEYGVRYYETKFAKFFDPDKIFPDDAVIALRTLPTSSVLTGKSRAEKLHKYHESAFKTIVEFEYPEGYQEKE